jgi:8-oxo-dGTP pyrophosphatase MutT (NUDIX family)
MELHDKVDPIPRPAATVVVLRDAPAGLEVFLLKRHGLSDVLGGAYVFPGGKVDREDALLDLDLHADQPAARLHAALHEQELEPAQAAALYVAAVREAFEEAGVLYAQGADQAMAQRASLLRREGHAFDEVLGLLGLRLAASHLLPWVRWITPIRGGVLRKRFDTRFFVAAVPPGQQPRHDDHEATDSIWLTPRAALQQYAQGLIELAPPQIMSLVHLAHHGNVAAVLAQARQRPPPLIEPHPFEHEGASLVCYPGDERHPLRERALPGPTRLAYRNKRFEPVNGFDTLLDD